MNIHCLFSIQFIHFWGPSSNQVVSKNNVIMNSVMKGIFFVDIPILV